MVKCTNDVFHEAHELHEDHEDYFFIKASGGRAMNVLTFLCLNESIKIMYHIAAGSAYTED